MEEGNICRVCRSGETQEHGPLFYPCKCSGSMKYIHQGCLEEWLKHSGKKSCDICDHKFHFKPIYDAQAPQNLSVWVAFKIIVKRIYQTIVWYIRVGIATYCWLVWVPFVTSLTWRLVLSRPMITESFKEGQLVLYPYLESHQMFSAEYLEVIKQIEGLLDWNKAIKVFFTLVFEGQIIASVVVILGLLFLLLREYVMANVALPPQPRRPVRGPAAVRRELMARNRARNQRQQQIDQLLADNLGLDIAEERAEIEAEVDDLERFRNVVMQEMNARRPVVEPATPQLAQHAADNRSVSNETFEIPPMNTDIQPSSSTEKGIEKEAQPVPTHRYNLRSTKRRYVSDENIVDTSVPTSSKGKEKMEDELENPIELNSVESNGEPSGKHEIDDFADLVNAMENESSESDWDDEPEAGGNPPPAENVQQPANMVLNVGIGDGEIVAQIEVNDFQAFLDMVGVNGSIFKLFQNVFLVHVLGLVVLGFGIAMPFGVGKFASYVFNMIIIPKSIEYGKISLNYLKEVTDFITEPIADFILLSVNTVLQKNMTKSVPLASENFSKEAPLIETVVKVLEVLNSTEASKVQYGPYNPSFFQSFHDDMSFVFLGYIVGAILFLLYAKVTGLTRNPYMETIGRLFHTFNDSLIVSFKILMFIAFELAAFPFYCGLLIDLCTLSAFDSSIAARLALQQTHPWMFFFVHWTLGSAFMFHFAAYVVTIRETLRPGVLWFIKDPNDPQFNAMQEILQRSIPMQLRKLCMALLFYGFVICGVFGLSIQLVQVTDVISSFLNWPMIKIFPLRLEYYDTISDIPFDLFFFQFAVPVLYRWVNPKALFKAGVNMWFNYIASKLRLSNFLLGYSVREEETDDESEELQMQRDWRNLSNGYGRVPITEAVVDDDGNTGPETLPDTEWEDVEEKGPELFENSKPRRAKRYLRVPNRDSIEVIPGEKMLIWMEEDEPIFGRPNESPEEMRQNWTKVYVPPRFYTRIFALLIFQWFTFAIMVFVMLFVPITLGRLFFWKFNQLTMIYPAAPPTYVNPLIPFRSELPTHDVYSYFAGIILFYVLVKIFHILKSIRKGFDGLRRKNAIRRSIVRGNHPVPVLPRERSYWERRGRVDAMKFGKLLYLFTTVGLLMPLMVGLCINSMLMIPLNNVLNRTPVIFGLVDWSTGAMALRVMYNFVLMNPNRRTAQIILQAQNAGLLRMDLQTISFQIIFPILSSSMLLLTSPFFAHVVELILELEVSVLSRAVQNYLLMFILSSVVGVRMYDKFISSLRHWFEHLKDDQYLIGQTLENVDSE